VLDVLPADDFERTKTHAVAGDGSVIAGAATSFLVDTVPLVWTFDEGVWLRAELPLPPGHGARPEFVSDDGSVATGVAASEAGGSLVENIAWAWRRVGGVWSGGKLPDGETSFDRRALSADGSTLVGSRRIEHEDESVTLAPAAWRHDGASWQVFTLGAPSGETLDGSAVAVSGDGRTVVGLVQTSPGDAGWRAVVWTLSEDGDAWSAKFLPGVGAGPTQPYSISHDGDRVVGELRKKAASAPVAALWTRVGEEWSVNTFGPGSGFSRGTLISPDGRLAFRDQASGRTLHHFASGRSLPLATIVATLEQRAAGSERWKFSGYSSVILGMGYDSEEGAYTIIGNAEADNASRPFVISGYAPFLFGETTRVGDRVEASVPDLGDGPYKVTGLPAGLGYDDATRTVSGRFSRVGLFTTTILNKANKRKRTVLTLVEPLPSTSIGAFQTLLLAGEDETYPVARLTVKATLKGTFTGTLESDDNAAYPLRGVFAPDPETPGELAAFASFGAPEAGLTVARKKGNPTASFRLRVNLRPDGTLRANLEEVGVGPYASSFDDGVLQTSYAGTRADNSAPWRGRYTASLGAAVALAEDGPPLPAGIGFAALTVSAKGKLSVSGRLADGKAFTTSVLPGTDGHYRLFSRPYKQRKSLFAGWLRFEPRDDDRYHVPVGTGGDVYWMRAPTPGSKLYPEGFGPAGLALRAEPWIKPALAVSFGVEAETPLPLRLSSADFSNDEGVNRYDLPQSARFRAPLKLAAETGRAGAMTFSVNRNTGLVTGGFTLVEADRKGKRRIGFRGVLLQSGSGEPDAPVLHGYFLQPALKDAESPLTVSGLISLEKPAE
jgi:Predicted integral membrane proteins containing uncharacterized repeats